MVIVTGVCLSQLCSSNDNNEEMSGCSPSLKCSVESIRYAELQALSHLVDYAPCSDPEFDSTWQSLNSGSIPLSLSHYLSQAILSKARKKGGKKTKETLPCELLVVRNLAVVAAIKSPVNVVFWALPQAPVVTIHKQIMVTIMKFLL